MSKAHVDVTITDKLPIFRSGMLVVFDDAVKEGARDGLIDAKVHAPFDKGQLRADSDVTRVGLLKWRISFWKEYARFQEFGGTTLRRVRNYSTSGTGAHFLRNAGDKQYEKLPSNFKKHASRLGVL